jgi:hypothetical protein
MSKTIEGIPEYLTEAQYLSLFRAAGITGPDQVIELRMAWNGIHVLMFALDERGHRVVDYEPEREPGAHFQKHRIFIPVRREAGDDRVSRVNPVRPGSVR